MSTHTLAQLEDAIAAHIRDEGDPGDMPTAWVLHVALVPEASGDSGYHLATPDGQATHTTIGLLRLAEDHALNGDDDD